MNISPKVSPRFGLVFEVLPALQADRPSEETVFGKDPEKLIFHNSDKEIPSELRNRTFVLTGKERDVFRQAFNFQKEILQGVEGKVLAAEKKIPAPKHPLSEAQQALGDFQKQLYRRLYTGIQQTYGAFLQRLLANPLRCRDEGASRGYHLVDIGNAPISILASTLKA